MQLSRYKSSRWAIARLDVDDNAGCVGKVSERDSCSVTNFSVAAEEKGALVFYK